jgi:hypothetical protein
MRDSSTATPTECVKCPFPDIYAVQARKQGLVIARSNRRAGPRPYRVCEVCGFGTSVRRDRSSPATVLNRIGLVVGLSTRTPVRQAPLTFTNPLKSTKGMPRSLSRSHSEELSPSRRIWFTTAAARSLSSATTSASSTVLQIRDRAPASLNVLSISIAMTATSSAMRIKRPANVLLAIIPLDAFKACSAHVQPTSEGSLSFRIRHNKPSGR